MDGQSPAIARAPETGPDAFSITDLSLKGDRLSLRRESGWQHLVGTHKAGGAGLRMTMTRAAKNQPNK